MTEAQYYTVVETVYDPEFQEKGTDPCKVTVKLFRELQAAEACCLELEKAFCEKVLSTMEPKTVVKLRAKYSDPYELYHALTTKSKYNQFHYLETNPISIGTPVLKRVKAE